MERLVKIISQIEHSITKARQRGFKGINVNVPEALLINISTHFQTKGYAVNLGSLNGSDRAIFIKWETKN